MLEPMATCACSTAASIAQSVLRSESRPAPCRRKPEGQCRNNGNDSGEHKHAPVECETCCAHCLGHELFKKPHCGHGEPESGNGPQPGKHQAFCQELREQSSTS